MFWVVCAGGCGACALHAVKPITVGGNGTATCLAGVPACLGQLWQLDALTAWPCTHAHLFLPASLPPTTAPQAPRRRFTSRQRTSRFMGVGSSNRKNQWQARILVHGKVTHLGYYETEEEAAKVYDK